MKMNKSFTRLFTSVKSSPELVLATTIPSNMVFDDMMKRFNRFGHWETAAELLSELEHLF